MTPGDLDLDADLDFEVDVDLDPDVAFVPARDRARPGRPRARGAGAGRWAARARAGAASGATDPGEEADGWERVHLRLPAGGAAVLREALEVAAQVVGRGAPVHARLEAICTEALATWPVEPGEELLGRDLVRRGLAAIGEEALEVEHDRWRFLAELSPVEPIGAAPGLEGDGAFDPWRADQALRALAAMHDRWDEVMGHLALLVRHLGLWQELGFASLSHYCTERLGLAFRTVELPTAQPPARGVGAAPASHRRARARRHPPGAPAVPPRA